jgi:hypothetical protein
MCCVIAVTLVILGVDAFLKELERCGKHVGGKLIPPIG